MELRNREHFLRQLMLLAIPIMFQNLISVSLNMVDILMIGQLGEVNVSAAAMANQPFFIFTLFVFGLSSGSCVLTSQYWGRKDIHSINKIITISLCFSLGLSLLFSLLVCLFPSQVLRIYTNEADVIAQGAKYLRIVGLSYLFNAFSTTVLSILRSVEKLKIQLYVTGSSVAVNAVLNYIFIFGKLGAPAMGIEGAALATLIARIYEFAFTAFYLFRVDSLLRYRIQKYYRMDRQIFRDFIRYCLPVIFNELVWGIGISFHSAMIGRLGTGSITAYSITSTLERLATVAVYGFTGAASITIGKLAGMSEFDKAYRCAKPILKSSVVLGLVCGGLVYLSSPLILKLYKIDDSTRAIAMHMILVMFLIITFRAINNSGIVGILRAGGDIKRSLMIDILPLIFLSNPAGAVCALGFQVYAPVVYLVLNSDQLIKTGLVLKRIQSKKWMNNLTRTREQAVQNVEVE